MAVTFACDGNRRKELHLQKQTLGSDFSFGAISTAVYRGVWLCDLFTNLKPDTKFIVFTGSDQLTHGRYETSLPVERAINPTNQVMVAMGCNGLKLTHDHGFPLRLIVPGMVGGRQVKWL